jgi:hypothetical protein
VTRLVARVLDVLERNPLLVAAWASVPVAALSVTEELR